VKHVTTGFPPNSSRLMRAVIRSIWRARTLVFFWSDE